MIVHDAVSNVGRYYICNINNGAIILCIPRINNMQHHSQAVTADYAIHL